MVAVREGIVNGDGGENSERNSSERRGLEFYMVTRVRTKRKRMVKSDEEGKSKRQRINERIIKGDQREF